MSIRVVRLGDPEAADAPFRFSKGARVAWKRWDGSPDPEFSGVVVDGICEYVPGGGAYSAMWRARRSTESLSPTRVP